LARLELFLLGSPVITLDGAPAEGFATQKARALLFYLTTESHHTQPHPRETLVGLLWPDMPDAAARANLRQALSNLREAIGDELAQPPFLSIRRESLQFKLDSPYGSDVAAFTDLLKACDTHPHRQASRCGSCARRRDQAIHLYRGDFLAGFHLRDAVPFEEWATLHRERLHRRMVAALMAQASFHEARREDEQALTMITRQLELDPWREEAHRDRMRLLAGLGRRSEALTQFEICRRSLAQELGVEPDPSTTRLHAQIRDGQLPLHPTPSSTSPRPLPVPSTPFIGRQRELAEVTDWLENPTHRLATLVGGSGVGKSRLALAAVEQCGTSFPDGVAYVDAGALDSAAQLPAALLSALDVPLSGPADPAEQLLAALQEREVLLVLDRLEHLLPDGRGILVSILARTRNTTMLVTSQERLGLQAEWCQEVEGLQPPMDGPGDDALGNDAVRLFLERGGRIRRTLGTDPRELVEVRRICRLVEGIPLAIELAASAVGLRTCAEIADELEADIRGLATEHHDIQPRHRSLAAALDYSWGLLGAEHQRTLRRLSVFRGGWEAQAGAQVAGATLDDLQALSDKSLIRRDATGRFEIHALMQKHAHSILLAADDAHEVQQAHLVCYKDLAEAAGPHLAGPSQVEWLPRLEREMANFRQALSWGLEQGEAELASQLCMALSRFWMIRGYLAEGQRWIESVLAGSVAPSVLLQARLRNRAGILAAMQGDFETAERNLQVGVRLSRELGDTLGEANSLNSLGAMSIEKGDYETARGYLEACLPAWRELENRNGLASTLNNLGAVELLMGDHSSARQRFEESLPLFRELGDRRMIAGVLYNLGDLMLRQAGMSEASRLLGESLTLRQEIGEVGGVAESLEAFARLALSGGHAAQAARLFGAAESMRQAVGAPVAPVNQAEHVQALESARRKLGQAEFEAETARGRQLTPSEAVHLALSS
jgi:predicted ATPase/DNA-binding SARP family transcriptional activator